MSNATPGPWIICGGATGANGRLVTAHDGYPTRFHVAVAELPPFGPDREGEREANACLIAAAPDLLAACKAAYSLLGPQHAGPSLEVSQMLAAAIAKAEQS